MKTGRRIANGWLVLAVAASGGCGLVPRHFPAMRNPDPLVRAAAIGGGPRQSMAKAAPGLVSGLQDEDPVVRLAAFEELHGRTGRTFGYAPWDGPEDRALAVRRWKTWLAGRFAPSPSAASSSPSKTVSAGEIPARGRRARDRRAARRKRRREASRELAQVEGFQ